MLYVDRSERPFFVIDGGTFQGVAEGMSACIKDDTGEEIFCGPVRRTKSTVAGIDLTDDVAEDVIEGQFVEVAGAQGVIEAPVTRPQGWRTSIVMTPKMPLQYHHADFDITGRMSGAG